MFPLTPEDEIQNDLCRSLASTGHISEAKFVANLTRKEFASLMASAARAASEVEALQALWEVQDHAGH